MKPLYIFDLDNTLALIDHRIHLVADKKNQRWDEFYRACVDDKPNEAVISILHGVIFDFCSHEEYSGNPEINADIMIFSGRSELVKMETSQWLANNTLLFDYYKLPLGRWLKMRKHGDYTPDYILKKKWYDELSKADKDRLVCVFEDRQKVVDMWRSIGVTCLQVAKGDF